MSVSAIILLSGVGRRFGKTYPKQYHNLCGEKIYLHTLHTFIRSSIFKEIILVCDLSYIKDVQEDTKDLSPIKIVEGGPTRQISSFNGIKACKDTCNYVVIHDAARPFVTVDLLQRHAQAVQKFFAVNTCIECSDTLVQKTSNDEISSIPNRDHFVRGQTPQSFSTSLIYKAHIQAQQENIANASDDCQLVTRLNHPIKIIKGYPENIKITTPLDLILAEQIMQRFTPFTPLSQSLTKKKFLLVGASGGIGSAIRAHLEKEKALCIPASIENSAYFVDLNDISSIDQLFKKIYDEFKEVDGLINCAGIFSKTPIDQMSIEEIQRLFMINLTGVIYCCKKAFIKKTGHILNIASSSYSFGRKGYGIYSASKAALVNFTQSLAQERPNMHINALSPHRTNTSLRRKHFPQESIDILLNPEKVAEEAINILKQKISGKTIWI